MGVKKLKEEKVGRRPWLRRVLRLTAALAVIGLALAAWRVTADFPSSWERRISEALSDDDMVVEVDGVSFSFLRMRLRAASLAVYPKKGERRAALSVSGAALALRPSSLSPDVDWLRGVRVDSLDFDVEALSSLSGESSDEVVIPDFGPIGISIRRAAGLGLEVRDLRGNLSVAQGIIAFDDASVSFQGPGEHEQTLRGRVCVDSSAPSVEAYGKGDLDFSKIVPLLRELECDDIAGELELFEFPVLPPRIETMLYWAPAGKVRSLGVSIEAGPMHYCGVRLSGLSSFVRVSGEESWERVDIDPLEVRRTEGAASGHLSIDIDAETLSFDAVSTIDPLSLAIMARIADKDDLPGVKFETAVEIRGSGTLGIGEGNESETSLAFSSSEFDAMVQGAHISQVSFSGGMKGGTLGIPRISAEVMGGTLEGSLRLFDGGEDGGEKYLSAGVALRGAQLSQLTGLPEKVLRGEIAGTLDMDASYEGPIDELGAKVPLRGKGALSADLRDALLFRIPLFAGLTGVLANYIPGVNFLVDQNQARIRATLEDGQWNVSKFAISGVAFSIDGSGTAAADGTDLNIVARLRLLNNRTWLGRCFHFLLSPVSGLLGVRATGNVSSPHWAPSPFSRSSAR